MIAGCCSLMVLARLASAFRRVSGLVRLCTLRGAVEPLPGSSTSGPRPAGAGNRVAVSVASAGAGLAVLRGGPGAISRHARTGGRSGLIAASVAGCAALAGTSPPGVTAMRLPGLQGADAPDPASRGLAWTRAVLLSTGCVWLTAVPPVRQKRTLLGRSLPSWPSIATHRFSLQGCGEMSRCVRSRSAIRARIIDAAGDACTPLPPTECGFVSCERRPAPAMWGSAGRGDGVGIWMVGSSARRVFRRGVECSEVRSDSGAVPQR